ncbi:MAG TPA: isoprenylcysteine carboxylmethyltransferase family protein [Thermomicrobiaceae bacterium]|nr:isoprenylcysteine carboxylmethyltransferase family protein [Thermomicrobiaceae bacterium]
MQGHAAGQHEGRWTFSAAGVQAGLDRWDGRLGTMYAGLASRRSARILGQSLAALAMLALVAGKWLAVVRVTGSIHSADELTSWAAFLNQLLQLPFVGLMVLLIIVRRPARTGIARLSGIAAALGGTFATSLLVLESNGGLRAALTPPAIVLLLLGMGWAIWSLATLGRCFSIVPEVRGLVTGGPYRWVRHPVYLGEITATLGLLLPILSAWNVAVFAVFCALQLWRTHNEEAGLAAAFPEYEDYRRRTARLVPGLW